MFRISDFGFRISAALSAIAGLAWPVAAAAAEIRLRPVATCQASVVRLADVAELDSDAEGLAQMPLCPAPAAGRSLTYSQHDVRQLLVLSGSERAELIVTGSPQVTISSAAPLATASSRPARQTEIRLAAHEASHPTPPAPSPAAATASAAKPAAEPALPRWVERLSSVTVQAQHAGVRISTSGKALKPGVAGETIPVELADSRATVLARVIGPQLVEVAVGGGPAVSGGSRQ